MYFEVYFVRIKINVIYVSAHTCIPDIKKKTRNDEIMKTRPCNTENFSSLKIEIFIGKYVDIFNMFAQNIDCGHTLEANRRGGSNDLCFGAKIRKIGIPPTYPSFAM